MQLIVFLINLSIIFVNSTQVPFIRDVILQPKYNSNSTMATNLSCDQCLCISGFSNSVINCFPNSTCQLFLSTPRTYQILPTSGARLYFPQQILPNASEYCTPDIGYLLSKMKNASLTSNNASGPRGIVFDDYDYLATIEDNIHYLTRFDPTNLTRIKNISVNYNTYLMTVAFNKNAYYIGMASDQVVVIDSGNLTLLNIISLKPNVSGVRDIIFLNDGQTMVVTSTNNNLLVFFNRSRLPPINYTFSYLQQIKNINPHGLWRVNDTFFYATSYAQNCIYSYAASNLNNSWIESLVINATNVINTPSGTHVTIDEGGRFWFSMEAAGVQIFGSQGNLLGNYTIPNIGIFETLIMDNYLMYFSSDLANQIFRLDPSIEC